MLCFAVIDYLAVLISVISFTSFLVLSALHSRRSLRNSQLSVTLQKLSAQQWKLVFQQRTNKMQHYTVYLYL